VLLGLSAGLLFSIATLELIPEAISMAQIQKETDDTHNIDARRLLQVFSNRYALSPTNEPPVTQETEHNHEEEEGGNDKNVRTAMIGIGTGFMFLILVEEIMSMSGWVHTHGAHGGTKDEPEEDIEVQGHAHSHNRRPSLRSSLSLVAFVGLAFHSLIDGMVIAGAFTASAEVGSRVALAILLHKFPDGFVMSSIIASQQTAFQSVHPFTFVLLIAGMTPLGAGIGTWLLGSVSTVAVAFILGFGAGTFLFITAGGILPELLQAKGPDKIISLACIVLGYLGFLLIDSSIHAH